MSSPATLAPRLNSHTSSQRGPQHSAQLTPTQARHSTRNSAPRKRRDAAFLAVRDCPAPLRACRAQWGYTLMAVGVAIMALTWCKDQIMEDLQSPEHRGKYAAIGGAM